ncbi:hypothetical protein MRX96_004444 [Rhipicephalus microplus]
MGARSLHAGEEPANLGGGLVNNSVLPASVCFASLLPPWTPLLVSCSPCGTVPPARPETCREHHCRVPSPSVSSLHVARSNEVDDSRSCSRCPPCIPTYQNCATPINLLLALADHQPNFLRGVRHAWCATRGTFAAGSASVRKDSATRTVRGDRGRCT